MRHPEPMLETDRCRLRALHRDDAPHVWDASRHPGFTDGMLWDPPDHIDLVYAYTEETLARWGKDEYCFTIEDKTDCSFLGRITIRKIDKPGVWDIGYFLHPKAWGKGYMTEALEEVLRFAFDDLGIETAESGHATWNDKSGNVLKRAGMRFVETVDCGFMKNGKPIPEHKYRITRAEFEIDRA